MFTIYQVYQEDYLVCSHYTRLHFGDGESYTWPITRSTSSSDRYAMSTENEEITTPSPPNLRWHITTLPTHPLPLELGMTRLGFHSAKGLLAGSLHRIWDDQHISAGPDPYC
jgi:hypothetical protein